MAHYRITTAEGTVQTVTATRLRRDGERLTFLSGTPQAPQVVYGVPAGDVVGIKRRVTELNGMHRWIIEPVPSLDAPGRGAR